MNQEIDAKKQQLNHKKILLRVGAVLLALTFWQILAMVIKQDILLVTPIAVCKRLLTIWQVEGFFGTLAFTMGHILGGFFLGLFAGILAAHLANRFSFAEILMWPYLVTIRAVPVASIVVICLIWLSARNLSIFISFLIVFPVVYQNVLTGLRSEDKKMQEMAIVFHLTGFRRWRAVTLPAVKPFLLSACSVTIGMAFKAGVAAEIIGTPNGSVGRMLYVSKMYIDTDDLLAWTVLLVLMSVLCEKVILYLLRKVLQLLA